MSKNALEVDLSGLRLLVERRGKAFALMELVQNAWDEDGVTNVDLVVEHVGRNRVKLNIADNAPEGFADLSHAYTLFAPSKKKANAEKRGRFNMGEKLVIALADIFRVETTKGGVLIDVANNERKLLRSKRPFGSEITATLRMTKEELADALEKFHTLIPPTHITTTINGTVLDARSPLARFAATLQTEIADKEGFLRPTRRQTEVEVYRPLDGEVATLYEMGIPVVETGDTFHVNIMQKVPLNADRDNVPPAFLRDVRAHVANETAHLLTERDATSNWLNEALEDDLIEPDAVNTILTKRYGEKRVIFDPSDREANRTAIAEGYSVIHGSSLSRAAWNHVREAGAALPAGQVLPSAKPFSKDGRPLNTIPKEKQTLAQRRFVRAVERMHEDLLDDTPARVLLANETEWPYAGVYCKSGGLIPDYTIYFNMASVAPDITNEDTLSTVIHEFGHFFGPHLTHAFDGGMGTVAAKLISRLIHNPIYFAQMMEG